MPVTLLEKRPAVNKIVDNRSSVGTYAVNRVAGMIYEMDLTVRGYELDSFGHVNNAVYLQYLEQARWEIMRLKNLGTYFIERGMLLVVAETRIRYLREARLFDALRVSTTLHREPPYLVFHHTIRNAETKLVVTRATVKTLLVDRDRLPHDIPDDFTDDEDAR